jgi:hypothetical protein
MHHDFDCFSRKHEQKEQNIFGLEQEEHEGRGAHDFARGDDHRGWKRGYGEIFFPKVEASYLYNKCSKWNMCSKYNFWQLVFLIH